MPQRPQHRPHLLLLRIEVVQLLRCRRRCAEKGEDTLESAAPVDAPQLIQRFPYGGAIQPPLRVLPVSSGSSPPLEEYFDRQLLRAGLVMNDPADDAGH